jgi:dynein heavy chain
VQLATFKEHLPLITALREPGMRQRHWEQLTQKLGVSIAPTTDLSLSKLLLVCVAGRSVP